MTCPTDFSLKKTPRDHSRHRALIALYHLCSQSSLCLIFRLTRAFRPHLLRLSLSTRKLLSEYRVNASENLSAAEFSSLGIVFLPVCLRHCLSFYSTYLYNNPKAKKCQRFFCFRLIYAFLCCIIGYNYCQISIIRIHLCIIVARSKSYFI